jgi:hypothetical protein
MALCLFFPSSGCIPVWFILLRTRQAGLDALYTMAQVCADQCQRLASLDASSLVVAALQAQPEEHASLHRLGHWVYYLSSPTANCLLSSFFLYLRGYLQVLALLAPEAPPKVNDSLCVQCGNEKPEKYDPPFIPWYHAHILLPFTLIRPHL